VVAFTQLAGYAAARLYQGRNSVRKCQVGADSSAARPGLGLGCVMINAFVCRLSKLPSAGCEVYGLSLTFSLSVHLVALACGKGVA